VTRKYYFNKLKDNKKISKDENIFFEI